MRKNKKGEMDACRHPFSYVGREKINGSRFRLRGNKKADFGKKTDAI